MLDNDVRSDDTVRSIIAFAIRWQQNSVVNINLTSVLKAAAIDIKYFARSKDLRSLVHKKIFALIWQVVFKLGIACSLFLSTSKKYYMWIQTIKETNNEIKARRYAFLLISDINVEKVLFFNVELKRLINIF